MIKFTGSSKYYDVDFSKEYERPGGKRVWKFGQRVWGVKKMGKNLWTSFMDGPLSL